MCLQISRNASSILLEQHMVNMRVVDSAHAVRISAEMSSACACAHSTWLYKLIELYEARKSSCDSFDGT